MRQKYQNNKSLVYFSHDFMDKELQIKKRLLESCKKQVDTKYETVVSIMVSNQKALESETKSSAGDKHETGRAHVTAGNGKSFSAIFIDIFYAGNFKEN